MARRQSATDRIDRLNQGCCPVHGSWMSQVGGWCDVETDAPYTVVGCNRQNCDVRAKAYSADVSWKLLPEFTYILEGESTEASLLREPLCRRAAQTPKAKTADIWSKTGGRCYYCGIALEIKTTFSIDHIISRNEGGGNHLENVVPCCRSCNSAKGTKSLEEFRFYRPMQQFQEREGVFFSQLQVAYLKTLKYKLDIQPYSFWFEARGTTFSK